MKKWTGIFAVLSMIVFILEPQTVLSGASSGLDICIRTVIPSLFPFFVISAILSNSMQGLSARWLRPVSRFLGIPCGSESIVLLGLCGGYPLGAKSLSDAYASKSIDKHDANRMLCFSSNAGPSFIFGMASSLFSSAVIPWFLWAIQILSMLILASSLPQKSHSICKPFEGKKANPMEKALKAMATVCGWIIFMRVILCLLNQWITYSLPQSLQMLLTGVLELSNGCIALSHCTSPILCYVMMGQFLSFGGVCVMLQTKSLIGDLEIKHYIYGKILQTVIASALLFLSVPIVFPGNTCGKEGIIWAAASVLLLTAVHYKNNTGNYRFYTV